MEVEIEKKYIFQESDYEKIKSQCKFIKQAEIDDRYLDNDDFDLIKRNIWLRKRNGKLQLKYPKDGNLHEKNIYIEYEGDEINNKLRELGFSGGEFSEKVITITKREKYCTIISGVKINIDVDFYGDKKVYELEVITQSENQLSKIEINELFDKVREKIGLTAEENFEGKTIQQIKSQQFELYIELKKLYL